MAFLCPTVTAILFARYDSSDWFPTYIKVKAGKLSQYHSFIIPFVKDCVVLHVMIKLCIGRMQKTQS